MKHCKGCKHFRRISHQCSNVVCHYALDTGKLRNSSPEDCDKYTTKAVKAFDSWEAVSQGTWNKKIFEEGLQ